MARGFVLGLIVLFCVSVQAQYPYVIDSFETKIRLNTDATIEVSETIDVTFNESRRGIFRTIPVVYDAGQGKRRAIQLKVTGVVDGNGNAHTTKITREGDYLKIRIGDADVFLDPGSRVRYVILYTVFGALNWHEKGDWEPSTELYWNVTGDEWDAPILSTKFSVAFPPTDGRVRGRVFAGGYGSRDFVELTEAGSYAAENPARTAIDLDGDSFEGRRLESLNPYQGMTLVLGVPQESVPKPEWYVELWRRLSEYLALFTPLVVAGVMFPIWWRNGRDKRDGPVTVRFEPPTDLPGAEAGTMLDERVDQRDIAAGIMSLCVKGYLTIEVTQDESLFKKREYTLRFTEHKDLTGLSDFELTLYEELAGCGTEVTADDLRTHVGPRAQVLRDSIYNDFVKRHLYYQNPNTVRGTASCLGVVLCAVVSFVLMKVSLVSEVWVAVLGGGLGLIPAIMIGQQMPRRTPHGDEVRRETLGFYEMMRHRENYMKWVVDKQPDGLKYEEYLPYAVAFDLIEQWNDAFKDIVREAPRWYHDPYGGVFYAHVFAHDLRSMTSDFGSAATTPPRSSGASGGSSGFSSGGGFSGGGFGGGGGGSW